MVQLLYEQGLHRFIGQVVPAAHWLERENLDQNFYSFLKVWGLPETYLKATLKRLLKFLMTRKFIKKLQIEKEKSRSKILRNLWRPLQKRKMKKSKVCVKNSLWCNIWTLLHQRANGKPEAVQYRKLILQNVGFVITGVRIVPFVWTKPENNITKP